MPRAYPVSVLIAGALLALATLAPGLDYFGDSSAIDALARGDWHSFFINQPMMGSLSLIVRAPFVRAVFHADLATVYVAGVVPCVAALVVLASVLVRGTAWRRADRALLVLLLIGSVPLIRAIHWGHPEDFLATAFAIGGMLAAGRGRPLLAGALIGAATVTKQWGILAALPALLVLDDRRTMFVVGLAAVGLAFTLPMLLGDPDRFWLVQQAAASTHPRGVLEGLPAAPGVHVSPLSLWLPFASERTYQGQSLLFAGGLPALAHPAVLLIGAVLPAIAWWRERRLDLRRALQLLALIMLARCALDPMDIDYYHLPFVVALAAAAAVGGRRDLDAALWVTAGFTIAFIAPATDVAGLEQFAWLKFLAYFVTVVPATAWLIGELYGVRFVRSQRASRSPRPQAA